MRPVEWNDCRFAQSKGFQAIARILRRIGDFRQQTGGEVRQRMRYASKRVSQKNADAEKANISP